MDEVVSTIGNVVCDDLSKTCAGTPVENNDATGADNTVHRRKQTRTHGTSGEAVGRLGESQSSTTRRWLDKRETTKPDLPTLPQRDTLQPVVQAFPRPKPPGKNRSGLATPFPPRNTPSASTMGTHGVANSRYNRKDGHDASEASNNVGPQKRKALRQLQYMEAKRVAMSPHHDRDDEGEDDSSGDVDDGYQEEKDQQPLLLTPKDIQRTYDALNGIEDRVARKPATQVAGSSSQESEVTAVDWSRFLSARPAPHRRQQSREGLRRESSWTSTTPTLTKQLSTDAFHHQHSVVKTNLSPLIQLRQSQLKQNQQEDLFGSKRRDYAAAEADQEIDGNGRFLFERTLEDWEREDQEVAAAAAAEEAALAAEERIFKDQGRQAVLAEPTKSTTPTTTLSTGAIEPTKEAFSTSLHLKHFKIPPTPSDSLLRTISYNGDPSKRPVPDFGAPSIGRGAAKVDVDYRQEQPLKRPAARANLRQQQHRSRQQSTPTRRTTATKSGHAGLYTPSKTAKYYMVEGGSTPEKIVSSPTMSRYLQLHD
ncbi:hypothetical protein DFQ27_008580 [Actinomortierella ambigua]|uniref:Uncharacterized protein n=1 Tax=Actinomortierella ambigua TaxID=1343610 RepID=A0A9P6TYN1_9FUNG|nr:hypothetical protein DFQ27_008580 [Actinomortierella ambigua]